MENSADPDQLASEEANWSGSTLFVKTGYIQAQQAGVILVGDLGEKVSLSWLTSPYLELRGRSKNV